MSQSAGTGSPLHANVVLLRPAGEPAASTALYSLSFPFKPHLAVVTQLSGQPGSRFRLRFVLIDEHGVEMDRTGTQDVTLDKRGLAHNLMRWMPQIGSPGVYWIVLLDATTENAPEPPMLAKARLHSELKTSPGVR